MNAAGGHRTDFRGELLERSSRLDCKRLAQDFAVLGFSRAAVFGSAQFEASDELRIEVTDDQLGHDTTPLISPLSILSEHMSTDGRRAR